MTPPPKGVRIPHTALVLPAAALVAVALIMELGLRAAVSPWAFLDPREDRYWAARMASAGVPRMAAGAADVELDPRLGWRMKRHHVSSRATHDARGYRAHRTGPVRPGAARVFMIGDSFVYGLGVKDDETAAARLQARTHAVVTNAGVNSYGADQALLMWDLEGRHAPVDIVVLGYYVDDFYRNMLSLREAPKPHLVASADGYRFAGIPVRSADAWLAEVTPSVSLRVMDVAAATLRRMRGVLGIHDAIHAEAAARSRHLLFALRDSVADAGARLLVVLIAHCARDDHDALWAMASIRRDTQEGGIALLDLSGMQRGAAHYGDNCHWNAAGNGYAARRIHEALRSRGWLASPAERR